jgi:hypothetical protein
MVVHTGIGEFGGTPSAVVSDGDWSLLHMWGASFVPGTLAPAVGAGTSAYTFTDGVYYPTNARALRCAVSRNWTVPALADNVGITVLCIVSVVDTVSGLTVATVKNCYGVITGYAGDTTVKLGIEFDFPLYVSLGAGGTRRIEVYYAPAFGAIVPSARTETLIMLGWKMS